jgi:hypothetical protein
MATFTIPQMLNITTGRLHTDIGDIYKFFNEVIEPGIFTHMLPNALKAILPILKNKLPSSIPYEGYHPTLHSVRTDNKEWEEYTDTIDITFTDEEKTQFWNNYNELSNPLEGKQVIIVKP